MLYFWLFNLALQIYIKFVYTVVQNWKAVDSGLSYYSYIALISTGEYHFILQFLTQYAF